MKIKPTDDQLEIIQDMIYENYSYTHIGKTLNMNDKTIKKIVSEYNLDTSKYNIRIALGKARKKVLTYNDIDTILKSINQGVSLRQIVQNFPITYPTLKRILDENGVNYKTYKRVSKSKFTLDNSQIADVKERLNNNESIASISKFYNVNRNTFSQYIKEIGIVKNDIAVSDDVKIFILECHKEYITINNISLITNINKETIKKIIDDCDIKITESKKYHKNHNGNLSNGSENLLFKLQEFNKICNIPLVNKSDINYLIENISKYTYFDIVKNLNVDYKELKHFAISIGHKNIFSLNMIMGSEYKEEFLSDLSNTAYSNSQIGFKYGVGYTTVSGWRKEIFGDVKSYYNANLSQSTSEMKFELILNNLGIAFIREYKLENLKYDYYIGHKILIEIHGDYWHREDSKSNEEIKLNICKKNSYSLLEITENDLNKDPNGVKKKVLDLYLKNIFKQYNLNN